MSVGAMPSCGAWSKDEMKGLSIKIKGEIRDRFKVKAFCLLFIMTTMVGLAARAQTSRVYQCRFTDEINATSSLRMKEYFDANTNTELGKIDLLVSGEVKESVQTQILEVPIWESDTYVKVWYSPLVRIDAILSWGTSSREFSATYLKNSVRKPINCSRIDD